MLTKRLCRRYPAVTITYLSYADDIAIITIEIEKAQEFLTSIEIETDINWIKTKVMVLNDPIPVAIYSQEHNTALKVVDNFKYLGLWQVRSKLLYEQGHSGL